MKKTMGKRVLSMLLTLCMVVGLLPAMETNITALGINDLNSCNYFIEQGPQQCTLAASLMMFRRAAIINGDEEWEKFSIPNYIGPWWNAYGGEMTHYPSGRILMAS